MTHVFEKESRIDAPAARVFAWHEQPDALKKLIPPGEPVQIVEHTGGIRDGARVVLRIGYWPFTMRWVARHRGYIAGRRFQDVQERGPFACWEHTHTMTPDGPYACLLHDHVEYKLPWGFLGNLGAGFVRRKLERMFTYRHSVTVQENE